MPIDYSKWDNLDEYSDDDDGGDGAEATTTTSSSSTATPRVARLDAPSAVTFGGSDPTTISAVGSLPSPEADVNAISESPIAKAAISATTHPTDDKWKVKGGLVTTLDNRKLYWAQDRYAVTLRCQLFDGEKPKIVTVDGILPYSDRHCAMGSTKQCLKVIDVVSDSSKRVTILEGDLPHHVHLANDEDDVDWCIERDLLTGNDRYVAITLHKAVPMQGLFITWKRPLVEFDETAVDQQQSPASKEFLHAWEEAHRLFKEKKRDPPVQL